jgi:hypothetical protein
MVDDDIARSGTASLSHLISVPIEQTISLHGALKYLLMGLHTPWMMDMA